MKYIIFAVLLVVLAGCTQPATVADNDSVVSDNAAMPDNHTIVDNTSIVGGDSDEHGCIGSAGYTWCEGKQKCLRSWEEPCEGKLSQTQARAIAEKSDCMRDGSLTNESMYNNVTGTWWIDMNLSKPKPGCNPACVVYEKNSTAEINWRCTGLIK